MNPADNSLEQGYEASGYNSSLETTSQATTPSPIAKRLSPFHYSKTAIRITLLSLALITLVGGSALVVSLIHHAKPTSGLNSSEPSTSYSSGSNLPVQQLNNSQQAQLSQANQLKVNGQLTVSKAIVLSPTSAPSTPVTGEIYYDQTSNAPYYYNGAQFISLGPNATPQTVTSLGGSAGAISLGSGLTVSGGRLSIASSVLQASSGLNTPKVDSLQGLTGNVSLVAGNGITISGTAITNNGVVSLNSSDGSILITNQGNGGYDIQALGGSGSGVELAPAAAQTDNSNLSSVDINKTGSGDLLELASSGTDVFVVDQTGSITTGTIDYSQVQGRPSTVVNSLGGVSGALTLGSGLDLTGSTLSNSGVVSITGTANQVIASASSGSLTLSLPQSIGTNSSPTFGGLSVTGGAQISGVSNLGGDVNVQNGVLTVGTPGSVVGNLELANTSSTNVVNLVGLNPTGIGNGTIQLPSIAGGSTDQVCLLNLGNCGSSPDTVTTSSTGTNNTIAKFTGGGTIANSGITDDGTTVSLTELLSANTISASTLQSGGSLHITPGGALTVGASSQILALQGNTNSTFSVSGSGFTTTVGFIAPTGNRTINFPNEGGTICLESSSNCGFASGGSGVTSLNLLSGALSIADATGSSSTITIQDASYSQLGLAEFNSSDFTDSSGIVDTIQGITTTSAVQFGSLDLGVGDLTLTAGATVHASNISNASGSSNLDINGGSTNIMFENQSGANSFLFPTTGGTGQVICTSGITCASGGGQAVILEPGSVQTASANKTSIFVNKASGTGDLLDLQTGGSDALTIDNSGNATFSNLTTAANLTVNGTLTSNDLTPTGALTVGSTSQQFTLQGSGSSLISATDSVTGFNTKLGFEIGSGGTAPTGSVLYQLENDSNVTPGTYTICSTAGNCAGVGGGITGSGAAGQLAVFSTSGNIISSLVSQLSGTVTVAGNLDVGASGAGQLSLGIAGPSGTSGTLVVNNSSNTNTTTIQLAAAPSGPVTLKLPDASGTFAVSASGPLSLDATTGALTCPSCLTGGGGGSGGVSGLDGLSGNLSIASSTGSGTTITIQDASTSQLGLVEINSDGNLTVSGSGVIDTQQGITTSSSPTFANLTVNGTTGLTLGSSTNVGQLLFDDGTSDGFTTTFSQNTLTASRSIDVPNAGGTLAVSATQSNNDLNLSSSGNLTISLTPSFNSVTTPQITGSGGLTLTPSGTLLAGSTSSTFTLQGNGSSTITSTSGGFTTTVGFTTPTTARSITFPDAGGTICTTSNNCLGVGGGANAALSNLSSVAINTTLLPGSSSGISLGSAALPFANIFLAGTSGSPGSNNFEITGVASGNDVITLPGSTGTLCINTGDNCNYANISTDTNYIQNQTSLETGNFNISGTGTANLLQAATLDTASSVALNIGTTNATSINLNQNTVIATNKSLTVNGAATFEDATNSTTAFQIQNASATNILNVDTSGQSVDIDQLSSPSGITTTLLPAPSAPTVGKGGAAGTTTYTYAVSAVLSSGYVTNPSTNGTVTTGNAILNSSNFNTISWSSVAGAVSYNVYRTSSGGTPSTTGLIANTTATSQNDMGLTATQASPSTGGLGSSTTYYYKVTAIDNEGGETSPSGEVSQATAASDQAIGLTWSPVAGAKSYRVYRGTSPGGENVYFSVKYPSFTDTGVVSSTAGTLPTTNTAYTTYLNNTQNSQVTIGGTGSNSSAQLYVGGNLLTPLAITNGGSAGTTMYTYVVAGVNASGNLLPPPYNAGVTQTGNATLSGSNYNTISWSAMTDAASYKIYRSSGGATGLIGTTSSTTFNDTGLSASGSVPISATGVANRVGSQFGLAAQGNTVFASGTQAYNVSNPSSPTLITPAATTLVDPVIIGHYLYGMANGGTNNQTLLIYDVSNPSSPTLVSTTVTLFSNIYATYLKVQGNYAYISGTANAGGGNVGKTYIYNVSNPTVPTIVSSLTGGSGIVVQGDYIYFNTGVTFYIYNVSNPSSPTLVGSFSNNDIPQFYSNGYLYATSSNSSGATIVAINVSNPQYPYIASTTQVADSAASSVFLAMAGHYIYAVTYNTFVMQIFDFSNPLSPVLAGETNTTSQPGGIAVNGNYAYVVSYGSIGTNGFEVFNLGGAAIQNLQSGTADIGNLTVDNSAQINGDEYIQGGLNVGENIQTAGSISANGSALIGGSATIVGGISGGLTINGLSAPGTPTIFTQGTTGGTSYSYEIVAVGSNGTSPPSAAGTVATGNATLTTSNYNQITWTPVTGATSYNIYRTSSGGTPSSTGLIGSTGGNYFQDTGLSGNSATPSSLDTSGQLTVNGATLLQDDTNSTVALQVENSTGTSIFNVDTQNGLVGTAATIASSTNSATFALQSGNATGTSSNSGNLTIDTGTHGTGGISGSISIGSANAPTINIGGNSIAQTVNVGSTSGSTSNTINIGTSSSAAVGITIGSTNSSSTTTLQAGATNLNLTNAGISIQQTASAAFTVQKASAGAALLTANTSTGVVTIGQAGASGLTGQLTFATSGNTQTVTLSAGATTVGYSLILPTAAPSSGQCLGTSSTTQLAFVSCGASSHAKTIVVPAEYAGAVLDSVSDSTCSSANTGTMTSGYSGDSSPRQNYYQWTTTLSGAQCYDVVVQVPIPSDWSSWSGTPSMYMYNSVGTNSTSVYVNVINSSGSVDSAYGGYVGFSSGTTLSSTNLTALSGTGYAAGGYLTLKIRMSASSSGTVEIGNISIPYNSAY